MPFACSWNTAAEYLPKPFGRDQLLRVLRPSGLAVTA